VKKFEKFDNLLSKNGEIYLFTHFFDAEESESFFIELNNGIAWKHEPIWMFGKKVMQPRLTAWYGDAGKAYRYSGILMTPLPWTSSLLEIKAKVEELTGEKFNSALLNLYRNGADSMGWHRDNEPELGVNPVIASVSLGAARRFLLREYQDKKNKMEILLEDGSLLIMKGESQTHWEHSIPKTTKCMEPRINITFRSIL